MITLTEKDADFVAKKAREVIESFKDSDNFADKLIKFSKEYLDVELDENDKKELSEAKNKRTETIREWQRVIELMMVGSEQ